MKFSSLCNISLLFLDVTYALLNPLLARDDMTMYEPLPGEIPSLIYLKSTSHDNRNCVGVLITRWHTMTSCSCLIAPTYANKLKNRIPDDYILVAGTTTVGNSKAKGQTRNIKLFVAHPYYEEDGNWFKYDIGIAVSEKPFNLDKYVETAKIPFKLEVFKYSQFFNAMLPERNYASAILVSWYKPSKNKHPKMIFVRMNVDKHSEVCKKYIDNTEHEGEEHKYTCVKFQTEFCPSFDEAAIFSDDHVFFGVVTKIKNRICNKKPIFFTNIHSTMDWIVHVVGKGNVRKYEPSQILLVMLLLSLDLNKHIYV